MNTSFFDVVKMINGEIQMTEEVKSCLDERKKQLTNVMKRYRQQTGSLPLEMDMTDENLFDDPHDGYIITAASLTKVNPVSLPDETESRLVFMTGYAVIYDYIEGLFQGDLLMRDRAKILKDKIRQFNQIKKQWEPYIKKNILDTIPFEFYQDSFDSISVSLMASIRPNKELLALSDEDFYRILMRRAIEIKERNIQNLEELTTTIRKTLRKEKSDSLSEVRVNNLADDDSRRGIIKKILEPLKGNNHKRKKFINDSDYERLYSYTAYLIANTDIPRNIQPILKAETSISNEYIMYTFHRLYNEIYDAKNAKPMRRLLSSFLQKVFEGLSGYEVSSIYKKLASEPKNYKMDFGLDK